jgi:ABC-2 type transport system permease protein
VADQAGAERLLRERSAAAFILLPPDFSLAVEAMRTGGGQGAQVQPAIQVVFGGDLTNPYYTVAGVVAITAVDGYILQVTSQPPVVQYVEQAIGASGSRTEFEMYVPGVLVFSIIMLVFLAAMVTAREVESGTLRRLQLTPLRAYELLGGISAALVLVGLASVALAFLTALGTGFRSQGSLWLAGLVATLTCLSVIGMGLVVASFSSTVSQAFVIANFPLGLFMFFSGSIYPLPKVVLFTVGEQVVSLYDILPPTHAVAALNKIFTLGAGIGELGYEMSALIVLSVLYFAAGVWLFQRTQLR